MFQPEPPASSRRPRRLRLLLLLLLLVGAGLLAAHYAGWLPGSAQNLSPAERDDALIARAEQLLARTDPPPQELYSMAVELYSDCHDHRRADPCVLRLVAEAARRGLPDARRSMGLMCRIGFSEQPRNAEQAREWYRLAAEDGELDAMILLRRSSKSRPAPAKPQAAASAGSSARQTPAAPASGSTTPPPANTSTAANTPSGSTPAANDAAPSAGASPAPSPAQSTDGSASENSAESAKLRPLLVRAGSIPVKHRVCTGDSLAGIARQYGISVDALRRANPGLSRLTIGSDLFIPDAEGQVVRGGILPAPSDSPETSEPNASGCERIHTVSSGETLGAIARRYGVSLASLLRANNLSMQEAARIHVGQRIIIP